MSEVQKPPRLQKWPFYLADLVLSGIAAYVLIEYGASPGTTGLVLILASLVAAAWGAWLSITPWLVEFRTHSSLAENSNLKSTLEQIQSLEKVAELIKQANAQWQGVQDASGRTVNAAREITEKMKVETDEFMKFIENAHNQERAGLRLEVDKLRKMEGDWIKVSVQILDHVFALFRAAEQSGQEHLVAQLAQFQNACREAARRMGLAPFVPVVGEKFDARGHQLPNPPAVMDDNATIGEVLATGFTYQGQLLRRSLVLLQEEPGPMAAPAQAESERESESPSASLPAAEADDHDATGPDEAVTSQFPQPEPPASEDDAVEPPIQPASSLAIESDPADPATAAGPSRKSRAAAKASAQNELPLV